MDIHTAGGLGGELAMMAAKRPQYLMSGTVSMVCVLSSNGCFQLYRAESVLVWSVSVCLAVWGLNHLVTPPIVQSQPQLYLGWHI